MTLVNDIVSPDVREQLYRISCGNRVVELSPEEKVPLRERKFDDLLRDYPELVERTKGAMQKLLALGLSLPAIHFTSAGIVDTNGCFQDTGFVDSIKKEGFRAGDTNVGRFTSRGNVATSRDYFEHPSAFYASLEQLMCRYRHHGVRTNKAALGSLREQGRGIPVMILIDTRGLLLNQGSDYDDHFILSEGASVDRVMAVIDADTYNTSFPEDIVLFGSKILSAISQFSDGLSSRNAE